MECDVLRVTAGVPRSHDGSQGHGADTVNAVGHADLAVFLGDGGRRGTRLADEGEGSGGAVAGYPLLEVLQQGDPLGQSG